MVAHTLLPLFLLALLNLASAPSAAVAQQRETTEALPGVPGDVLAAAADLDAREASDVEDTPFFNRERAKLWAPGTVVATAAAVVAFTTEAPRDPRWQDRNSFDSSIQDGLAGDSRSTRDGAAIASTVLLSGLGVAMATDIALLRDEHPLEQSLMVALTTSAGNLLLNETVKVTTGRERPYVRSCSGNPKYVESCNSGREDNDSFYSLHASESATLASLICLRHLRRARVSWLDKAICAGAAATSATTGILRITAEEHYATDVLTGWGTGVLFGAVLPMMLPEWSGLGENDARQSLAPLATGDGIGLQYSRAF